MDDTFACLEDLCTSGDVGGHLVEAFIGTADIYHSDVTELRPAAVHRVGMYEILYDLDLPTDEELADDGGMAAFLAECTEVD